MQRAWHKLLAEFHRFIIDVFFSFKNFNVQYDVVCRNLILVHIINNFLLFSLFSLFHFSSTAIPGSKYRRPAELITFANPAFTKQIFHLQCTHGPNDDWTAVVARRVDGDIELWDDRQPRAPAVIYKWPTYVGKLLIHHRIHIWQHPWVIMKLLVCGI